MKTEMIETTLQASQGAQGPSATPPAKQPGHHRVNIGLLVRVVLLLAVLTAGIVTCVCAHSEWSVLAYPVLGGLAVALTWAVLRLLCFARNPVRYGKSFTRPIFYALLLPLWVAYTAALFALPVDVTYWRESLVEALISLLVALLFFAAPVVAAVLGIMAVTYGVMHLKMTPQGEHALYREGPLVLACLLCVAVAAVCVFGVFALL